MANLRQYLQSLLAIFRHTQDDCCAISTAITIVGQNLRQYPRFLQFLLQFLRSKTISSTISTVTSTTISTGIQYPMQYLRLDSIIIRRGYCNITCCIFHNFPVICTNLIICSESIPNVYFRSTCYLIRYNQTMPLAAAIQNPEPPPRLRQEALLPSPDQLPKYCHQSPLLTAPGASQSFHPPPTKSKV